MPTILIVDDDKFTRSVLENVIVRDRDAQALALDVVTAADGVEGLEIFKERRPDVVISDLLMPRLDGFELCRRIRAEPGGQDALLIVVSGVYRDRAISERLASECGAAFFTKPYQLREVTTYVVKHLLGSETTQAPRRAAAGAGTGTLPQSGELRTRPLPALLFDLLEAEATGRLWLRRGRVSKTIDLHCGHPVSAASNARDETLGHYLVIRGIIDASTHERAVHLAAQRKQKLGQVLIEQGLLTPESLVEHLTGQIRFRVAQSLRWADGSWRFERTQEPPSGVRGNAIDIGRLILDGLRDTESADTSARGAAELAGRTLTLTPRGQKLLPELERRFASILQPAFHPETAVEALVAIGLRPGTVASLLDVLRLCDGVSVGPPVNREGVVSSEQQGTLSEGISVSALSRHSDSSRDTPPRTVLPLISTRSSSRKEPPRRARVPHHSSWPAGR